MLFWVILAAAIILIILNHLFWMGDNPEILGIVLMIIAVSMAIFILVVHGGADGSKAGYEQTYASLVYQLNNNLYDNNNDIVKKELFTEIKEYNEDIACNRAAQDNFWIGIFIPDIYDELELIELEKENV